MTRQNGRCDPDRLRLLLEGRLAAERVAEAEGHLGGCGACQKVIEGLAAGESWWGELRRIVSGSPAEPADRPGLEFLDPPDDASYLGRLGPFAVTAVLGCGGMGIVLKAVEEALGRTVALKVLAPHFAGSGSARQRFAREARAAAAVVHEHVVPIHGVGEWKGLPYLVMALVDGRSLQERLDAGGALEVREVLRIGMQAALGLAAAHAQGLVHRDVKPANILLENGVERVRLTDFGLARAADDASLTRSGVIAGTPQYMAPEQARGEAVDHRADLFSLGSVLYAMCTGHAPFRAEGAVAVLRRVCDERARPVRQVNPDVPTWLAGLIEQLHAKRPADRPGAAAEVAERIGRGLAHLQRPGEVAPPAPLKAGRPSGRRGRFFRLAIAAIVLTALGLVSWSAARRPPSLRPPEEGRASRDGRDASARIPGAVEGPGAGPADPVDDLLRDARRRLEAIERELGAPSP